MCEEWFKNKKYVNTCYRFLRVHYFSFVCASGENIAHIIQLNKPMYMEMEFYFLNWVQLSYDFGKVVPSGTTPGYFRPL